MLNPMSTYRTFVPYVCLVNPYTMPATWTMFQLLNSHNKTIVLIKKDKKFQVSQ